MAARHGPPLSAMAGVTVGDRCLAEKRPLYGPLWRSLPLRRDPAKGATGAVLIPSGRVAKKPAQSMVTVFLERGRPPTGCSVRHAARRRRRRRAHGTGDGIRCWRSLDR